MPCWRTKDQAVIVLNGDRWVLEVYRTIIGTLQGVAWMLLLFFAVALIACVIVKRRSRRGAGLGQPAAEQGKVVRPE